MTDYTLNSDPAKLGLRIIGEVDWSDGSYCFDYTTVWQRIEGGAFLWGEDSGCSCPSPYESQTPSDLTEATIDEIKAQLDKRIAYSGARDAEIAELLEAMLKARP